MQAFEHGDYPFPRLARELRLDRDPGRSIVRAMLVLQPGRSPEESALAAFALGEGGARADFGGLALEVVALPEIRAGGLPGLLERMSGGLEPDRRGIGVELGANGLVVLAGVLSRLR